MIRLLFTEGEIGGTLRMSFVLYRLGDLEGSLQAAPESAVCHMYLGSALYNTSEFAGAKKEYEIAIRLDPSEPMGYRNLGRAEQALGEDELAKKQYRLADDLHGLKPGCRPTLLKAVVQ